MLAEDFYQTSRDISIKKSGYYQSDVKIEQANQDCILVHKTTRQTSKATYMNID